MVSNYGDRKSPKYRVVRPVPNGLIMAMGVIRSPLTINGMILQVLDPLPKLIWVCLIR